MSAVWLTSSQTSMIARMFPHDTVIVRPAMGVLVGYVHAQPDNDDDDDSNNGLRGVLISPRASEKQGTLGISWESVQSLFKDPKAEEMYEDSCEHQFSVGIGPCAKCREEDHEPEASLDQEV